MRSCAGTVEGVQTLNKGDAVTMDSSFDPLKDIELVYIGRECAQEVISLNFPANFEGIQGHKTFSQQLHLSRRHNTCTNTYYYILLYIIHLCLISRVIQRFEHQICKNLRKICKNLLFN